jgi:ABC-2 type transport system ATP-binding protein
MQEKSFAVTANGITKSFGDIQAVAGVSLHVAEGETYGLLGPNGAGKTTTINMLIGAIRPDSGSITIDGKDDPTLQDVRKSIGVAPQSLALYEDLSAEFNVRFFARMYGLSGARLKSSVDWAFDFAGLTDRKKSKVSSYSGGMKRRLNLACALVHDPQVVFLDEPMVGVDPQSRNHMFERINELKQSGKTIIYTTHYMEEASRLCDRIAIMDNGRILESDNLDGLLARYGGPSTLYLDLDPAVHLPEKVPGVVSNGQLRISTDNPLATIIMLHNKGVRALSLRVEKPDLESVFIKLTGRKLRDE